MSTNTNNKQMKAVYVITEIDGQRSSWTKIGVAFTNRDGSQNLILDALPVSGRLHIRDFKADEPPKAG